MSKNVPDSYVVIKPTQIGIDKPVPFDVYHKVTNKLQLRKGKKVISDNQYELLIESGKFRIPIGTDNSICDLTQKLKSELALAFDLLENQHNDEFIQLIGLLALQIQMHCRLRPDALLAALHTDHKSVYSLVQPLHCGAMCEVVAKAMGMSVLARQSLICAALTQNIGYYNEQQRINDEPGALNETDRQLIIKHPSVGYGLLVNAGVDNEMWLDAVLHHHEQLNGDGYPHQLKGVFFPIHREILALADAFCASTRAMAYSAEIVSKDAMRELLSSALQNLPDQSACTATTKIFIKTIGANPSGTYVQLANNEVGIVFKQEVNASSPLVAVVREAGGMSCKEPIIRDTAVDGLAISSALLFGDYPQFDKWIDKLWPRFVID